MSKPAEVVLQLSNLRLFRGKTQILDDISWTVRKGEHWVILGANGSGKTSMLSALTGYLMASSGEIELLAHRYGQSDWRELRKRVGLVSSSIRQRMGETEPALETVVSGKHAMIDFWGKMTSADRRRGLNILAQVECSYLADRPWQFLSQGERQRVLIGRALMANPPLLILDEPCAGLDPAAREQFLTFVQRLGTRERAPTLVLVTHHVEEIMPVFTHVMLLRAGQVVAGGEMKAALNSKTLSETFGTPIRLRKIRGRYALGFRGRVRTRLNAAV